MLGLHRCSGFSLVVASGGYSLIAVCRLLTGAFQVPLVAERPPGNAGDVKGAVSVLGSGRSPGGGHGKPLQYSCPENPVDTGAWQATVHRVTESNTTEAT